MFKRNLLTAATTAALLSLSAVSLAQETTPGEVSVTVTNGFTLANTANLTFGTIRATQGVAGADNTTTAYVLIGGDGTVTTSAGTGANTGVISSLVDGTPARYDVSGAAPFTNLTLLVGPATYVPFNTAGTATGRIGIVGMGASDTTATVVDPVELSTPGGAATDALFFVAEVPQTQIIGGLNDGDPVNATGTNIRTDGTGAVGLSIGGYLYIPFDATASPSDGAYTGSYEITLQY